MALAFATGCTCAGLDAPLCCLKGIVDRKIECVFASDIDPKVRSFLNTSTPRPQTIFADINDRIDNSEYQGIDLYVAGFPCQTFSSLGKRKRPRECEWFRILANLALLARGPAPGLRAGERREADDPRQGRNVCIDIETIAETRAL